MRAALVKTGNVFVVERIDVEDPGIEAPEQWRALLSERSHGRELRSAKNHEERRVDTFAVPPRLQDGRKLRSLGDQIREFIEDQGEASRAFFPRLRLLRGVAQKGIPGDGNFLSGNSLGWQGCDQLTCKHQPLRRGGRLLGEKVAMRLFRLISSDPCCEVPLEQECLAQSPTAVEKEHLPTGPVAFPSAIQGRQFEHPVVERIGFDRSTEHVLGVVFAQYDLSCHTVSSYTKTILIAAFMSDRRMFYRSWPLSSLGRSRLRCCCFGLVPETPLA